MKVLGDKKMIALDPFKPPHAFQPLGGVAVIADNTFAAFKGRKQLKVEWDNGANASYNSADYKKELQQTARQPGKVVHTSGDPDAEFAKGGKPEAWLQRSVFAAIGSAFEEGDGYGSAGEMSMGWNVVPFDVPNFRSENGQVAAHVRIGWLRSVANIYHAFGVQSFANEM